MIICRLFIQSFNRDDFSISIVLQFTDFQTAKPGFPFGRYTVVMEQIPFSFELNNSMMSSPSHYRSQDNSLISKWSVWVVTYRVTKQMGIACRVREIIFPIILMYPGSFEETTFCISCCQRFTVFIGRGSSANSIISSLKRTTRDGKASSSPSGKMADSNALLFR